MSADFKVFPPTMREKKDYCNQLKIKLLLLFERCEIIILVFKPY